MRNSRRLFFVCVITIFATIFKVQSANAGLPDGPFLVWANIGTENKEGVDKIVRNFLSNQSSGDLCDDTANGWIIYTKTRPDGFSDNLLQEALLDNSTVSKKKLKQLIRNFRAPGIKDGLDGVVVFAEKKGKYILSMDANGKIVRSKEIEQTTKERSVTDAFCDALPSIYRR